MRNLFRSILAVVALVVLGLGFTAANASAQRPDMSSGIFPAVTLAPVRCINAACTGTAVDLANYASAMLIIQKGYHVNSATAARYAVLIDSAAGAASAAYDSVLVDTSATSTTYTVQQIAYRGAKRWIRVTVRAGGTLDTMFLSVTVLRGSARFRN